MPALARRFALPDGAGLDGVRMRIDHRFAGLRQPEEPPSRHEARVLPESVPRSAGRERRCISGKITNAFNTLFHGAPSYRFYETMADDPALTADQAYILDTLHDDIRTEGMGLGMMICVEMNKQHRVRQALDLRQRGARDPERPAAPVTSPPSATTRATTPPLPRSLTASSSFVTALIFANDRWRARGHRLRGRRAGAVSYARHKEDDNGGSSTA